MVVTIEEIKEGGLELNEPVGVELVSAALVQEGRDTGFRASKGFQLRASLSKVSGGVLLRAECAPEVEAPCKRCLKDVTVRLPIDFTLNMVPESLARADEFGGLEDDEGTPVAGSFVLNEADEELFDGKHIDLDPILREQVLLALPMSVVCQEDCKGLCTVCGQNLNDRECGCDRKIVDPRLLPLKNIKIN